MGIKVEFNPDLALRNISQHREGKVRSLDECIPENLRAGGIYPFLKKGQRNYWLEGEIPLLETEGNEQLSRPLASIRIEEAAHFLYEGEVYTKGTYHVLEVFDRASEEVKFEAYARIQAKTSTE